MYGRDAVMAAAALILAAAACAKAFRRRSPEVRKRGVILRDCTSRRGFARGVLSSSPAADVTLAGISIPGCDETKHFKIIGTTGTGKSTVIREILAAALARGDRAVVADPDESDSAALDIDFYAARPGIQAVLDELLDHGGRALDHLAGSDLVDELIGQYLNGQGAPRERRIFAQRGEDEGSMR